jgi:GntR family transcriptional regulator
MLFQVDSNAATALYRQLVDQIRYGAASGALKVGESLPSIRPLARQLHLNRNTVAKAYSELENSGVIKTIPGKGCFVQPVETPLAQKFRRRMLAAKLDAALVAAHQLEIASPEFLGVLEERIGVLSRRQGEAAPVTQSNRKTKAASATKVSRSLPARTAPSPKQASPVSPLPQSPQQMVSASDASNWAPGMD